MKNWYAVAGSVLALIAVVLPSRAEDPWKLVEPPKGSVFVELKTNEEVAAGSVGPGSRVDVVFKTTEPKTTVILEDLLVYAVDTQIDTKTYTFTVCVTKAQSLVIDPLIKDKVKPQITLRPPCKK